MHISEGVLSPPVLATAALLTAGGTWLGLRRLDDERLLPVAVLTAVFFVASLVHVPLGPSSVHLLLGGLAGLLLGWVAFPAILVGLLLQALLFQFGGFTVLGVNTLNVAGPAVLCHYLFRGLLRSPRRASLAGFLAGAGAVLGTALAAALSLTMTDAGFLTTARMLVLAHLPLMLVEGLVTMFVVGFLAWTRPELLVSLGCCGGGPALGGEA